MINALSHLLAVSTSCVSNGNICETGLPGVNAGGDQLQIILQIVFGVLAALAVLMVTIGGLRYVMSEGNPETTKQARSTILYAIVGLVIALSAEALVSFFLGRV